MSLRLKYFIVVLLFAFAPSLCYAGMRLDTVYTRAKHTRAFLVGVTEYADAPVSKYSDDDVNAVRDKLLQYGVPEDNIVALTSGSPFKRMPIKTNIDREFKKFLKTVEEDDFVVVYFSGHGFHSTSEGDLYFAAADISMDDADVFLSRGVSLSEIMAQLADTSARYSLVLVDAGFGSSIESMFKQELSYEDEEENDND